MSQKTNQKNEINPSAGEKQTGFLGRVLEKLDDLLKQKAEKKSQQSSCCGGSDDKGGKCC